MSPLQRGSVSAVVHDYESTYKTVPAAAARRPQNLTFNQCTVVGSRNLNELQALSGDQNPKKPILGNKDVSGNLAAPLDTVQSGLFLKDSIGAPTTVEYIWPNNRLDVKVTSTATISSGTITFSASQTGAAVGDMVVMDKVASGVTVERFVGYLQSGSGTSWGATRDSDGNLPLPDQSTALTVTAIINMGMTMTISGGSGGYTLSEALAAAAAGDRVVYENAAGTRFEGYITTDTNDTTGVLDQERDGATAAADVTDATVLAIIPNLAESSPGTIDIASGVATFSATHANLAAGQLVILDAGGTKRKYEITAKLTATTASVVDGYGLVPADEAGSVDVETIEALPFWRHTYTISQTDELPSFVIDKAFEELTSNHYDRISGCRSNSLEITLSGDGEVTTTMAVVGAQAEPETDPYDDDSSTPAPADTFGEPFEMLHTYAYEGANYTDVLREVNLTLGSNLDTSLFTIGGGGVRRYLPSGVRTVGGSIVALFESSSLLTKSSNAVETQVGISFHQGKDWLAIDVDEALLAETGPPIEAAGGIAISFDFLGYKDNGARASAVVAELVNQQALYA